MTNTQNGLQTVSDLALVPALGSTETGQENGSAVAAGETAPGKAPKSPRKSDEEFNGFARRMIRAYGKRAGEADPWVAKDLLALQDEIEKAVILAIAQYKQAGLSWRDIADELGIDRVACFKRYAKKVDALLAAQDGAA
jgi:hypothetical protein